MIKYLLDENVDLAYLTQLQKRKPDLTVLAVGKPDAPPKRTPDPEILYFCEENNFILVTNNRASMPVHLTEHIEQGHHVPGILILDPERSIGENLEELILMANYSFDDEYQDRITYLPLP